jgi:hypothetical protein
VLVHWSVIGNVIHVPVILIMVPLDKSQIHSEQCLSDNDKTKRKDHRGRRGSERDSQRSSVRSGRDRGSSRSDWSETPCFKDEPLTPNIKIKDSPSR